MKTAIVRSLYSLGLGLVLLALSGFAGTPAAARSMQDIVDAGEFDIGVIPYPPDIIKDPVSGEYKGVFVDAIKYVCKEIKVKCKFREFTWGTFVAGLQARQIDLSIATTYATIPRALAVNFSRPIYYLGYKAVSQTQGAGRFKDVSDLNDPNVTIAVCQGCGQHDWVLKHAPKAQVRAVKTEEGAMLEVVTGKADVGVGASAAVNYALAAQSTLTPVLGGRIYSKNQVAWALNKDDQDILNFINVAIGQLISTGVLIDLAKQYEAPWIEDLAF
jgi:ABC-type amino acid transport substrate-binding protein